MNSNRHLLVLLCVQVALTFLLCGCDAAQEPEPQTVVFQEVQEVQQPAVTGDIEPLIPIEANNNEEDDEYALDGNILEYMKDGMDEPVTKELFKEDIELVEHYSITKLKISYFDFDLNDDGFEDKIVIISSGIHSGAGGDPFYIAINTGNGFVLDDTGLGTRALHRSDIDGTLAGSVRIVKRKIEGFYILEMQGEEHFGWNKYYMVYEDGGYRYKKHLDNVEYP